MEKALRWAIFSAQEIDEPVLTAFVLPNWTGTAYLRWTLQHSKVSSSKSHLGLEVVNHLLNTKGGICKEADVVGYSTVTGGNKVGQAEVGRVVLLSLLPQPVEPASHTRPHTPCNVVHH